MVSDKSTPNVSGIGTTSGLAIDTAIAKFLPYLQEIQKKLTILLIVILVSGISGFLYYQKILTFVMHIFNLKGITVVLSSPYQFIDLAVNTGIATGVIIAFPLFIYYLLSFLKPALASKEYGLITRLVPFTLLLFIIGFGFGGWVMQFVINLFTQTAINFDVTNIWDISHFFSQTIIMGVCLGLLFEMPVVVTLLIRLKILKKKTIAKNRRYIYTAILILAALLPPSDVISLSILTIVPLSLFELALLFNKSI
ncbi:MAG: Sec-independent protein translocase, TatC subunit [Candidatus Collierbacteria bacterium GW2011_GWB1_44_197]|nr:MAG: Sec-independent protein translocase, TatC subunit [Candidatus Collierbacteria bacterium GW2011_GWB1_44_197]